MFLLCNHRARLRLGERYSFSPHWCSLAIHTANACEKCDQHASTEHRQVHHRIAKPRSSAIRLKPIARSMRKKYYFEGKLEILSAPDLHARVVHAQLVKPIAIDGKQTTSHSWTPRQLLHSSNSCQEEYYRMGSVFFSLRFISLSGVTCQLKIRFQSKPPTWMFWMGVLTNWKVESSIISINGTTAALGLRAIGSSSGSSQPEEQK